MADEHNYLVKLAAWLSRALGQGAAFAADLDSDAFGLRLPESVLQSPQLQALGSSLAQAGADLVEAANELEAAAGGDEAALISGFAAVIQALVPFIDAVAQFATAMDSQIRAAGFADSAERAAAEQLAADIARVLIDYLIINVIEEAEPRLMVVLKLLGLIDWRAVAEDPAVPGSQPYVLKRLRLERLKDLFTNPGQHFLNVSGWGTEAFDPGGFFQILAGFFDEEADAGFGEIDGDPYFRWGPLRLRRDSRVSPPGIDLEILGEVRHSGENRIPLNPQWGIGLMSDITVSGGVGIRLEPIFTFSLLPAVGDLSGELRLFFDRNPDARPFDIVGGNSLINLSASNIAIGAGISARAEFEATGSGASLSGDLVPLVFADITGLTLRLGSEGADGFLADMLASAEIEGQFDLGLEWRGDEGLVIKASGGIEIAIPIHKSLGFIEFDTIVLALRIREGGTLSLEISTTITGLLGPLTAVVERMGVQLDLGFPADTGANFFDLDLGFKPPNGVGLSIDAGVVKGGGYLFFDFDREEYAGALELEISGFLTLKAIGLITTRMPDGSKGFSLLIIITAEFGSPFQLGFGFTLSGVGGLLGLNRTMRLQPLAEGVRTGSIQSIMFPTDVVANAPRIISDLRTFFPPQQGIFLIGPMAKLGWGTPNLITLSLGIIFEIPGNIAIVGVLKVALPDEDAALLVLQVNFIGAIEFDKDRAWFFASLFESRVLFMTIDGEMGLLIGWGSDANFVVSLGGFHPAYTPPPLPFPSPRRIAISILNTDYARVRVEAYFAVTSNTVQFGAAVEIFFGVSAFNIDGHLGLDALFQFSPFYFIVSISASLSVKVFGVGLLSVRMAGSIEGPTPWHIEGTGSLSLLFFDIDVDFSHTWGEEEDTTLPAIAVLPMLQAELEKPENWTAAVPAANQLLVSLRKIEADDLLVLHPVGTLKVSQRAIPLELTLDKVGAQRPGDADRFSLSIETAGFAAGASVEELFASAQFLDMDDARKLSSPAFEPQRSGLALSVAGARLNADLAVRRVVRYEQVIIDSNYKRFVKAFLNLFSGLFTLFLSRNAVARSVLSRQVRKQLQPFDDRISIRPNSYAVAFNTDNRAFAEHAASFTSKAKAEAFMREQVARDRNLGERLHVIPSVELEHAA